MESSRTTKNKIVMLAEESQQTILDRTNQSKPPNQIIPVVLRNFQSGWPLIQSTLFSMNEQGTGYIPVLGGGKCHGFMIAAFSLAASLAKINKNNVYQGNRKVATPKEFTLANVYNLLQQFSLQSIATGIIIESKMGGHGQELLIKLPVDSKEPNAVRNMMIKLSDPKVVFNKKSNIEIIGTQNADFEADPGYDRKYLEKNTNTDIGVFSQGQVFIDLGLALDKYVKDTEIKEYFETIFKVKEFLQLKNQEPNLQPIPEVIPKEISPPRPDPFDFHQPRFTENMAERTKPQKVNNSEDLTAAITTLKTMIGFESLDEQKKDRMTAYLVSIASHIGSDAINKGVPSVMVRANALMCDPKFEEVMFADMEMRGVFIKALRENLTQAKPTAIPKLSDNPNIHLRPPQQKPAAVEQSTSDAQKPGKK